jgi:hypothetical protein
MDMVCSAKVDLQVGVESENLALLVAGRLKARFGSDQSLPDGSELLLYLHQRGL